MRIFRSIELSAALLIPVFLVSACAGEEAVKIGDDESARMAEKRLAVTVGNPTLTVAAPGGAAMPLSDVAQMGAANDQLVGGLKVDDPAVGIARKLATYLESQRAMVFGGKVIVDENETAESLVSRSGDADYVLDVRTGIWDVRTTSSYTKKYFVAYKADIRLIETGKNKVIAKGTCSRLKPNSREALSLQQLRRDDAAKLKKELREVENHCIREAKRAILP